jgi:DNA mismatch endonuclease (patch repair protein)
VIFVHGCFWHRHDCVMGRKHPSANPHYWQPKLKRNAVRDAENMRRLAGLGWSALVLWECELADHDALAQRIRTFLSASPARREVCRVAAEQLCRS